MPTRSLYTICPGRISYAQGLELQQNLIHRCIEEDTDFLLLVEHPAVITLGRGARQDHILTDPAHLTAGGIDIVRVSRGGDATFHEPGQLVGYPIVNLSHRGRDLHRFLRQLEEALLHTLTKYEVQGRRIPGKTGVWVGDEKIASIGIGVRRWVSWHGFALNVLNPLSGFSHIVPCGMPNVAMTSLERTSPCRVSLETVTTQIIRSFEEIFGCRYLGHDETTIPKKARLA